MTKDELIKNLAWLREEAGLESAYPINHPMAKFIMAVSERAKSEERKACANLCWKSEDDNAFANSYNGKRLDLLCSELIKARGEQA